MTHKKCNSCEGKKAMEKLFCPTCGGLGVIKISSKI